MLHRLTTTVLSSVAYAMGLMCVTSFASKSALADQNAPELPGLFEQLREASVEIDTRALEIEIWRHWLTAPDPLSDRLMSRISLAMAAGELDSALTLCNQLVGNSPDFAEAWNKRATLHYMMGDHDSSVSDIRETLVREPRHFGAISGLGLIFMHQKNLEAAMEAFEQVLVISPGSVSARSNIEFIRNRAGTEI